MLPRSARVLPFRNGRYASRGCAGSAPRRSRWRHLGYLALGWAVVMIACRLLLALVSDQAPYAWAAIILLGMAATLASRGAQG